MSDPGAEGQPPSDLATPQGLFGPEVGLLLEQYIDILASRGIDWGVIGPREAPRLFDRHILNSLAVRDLLPQGVEVVDIGSGAGLPGIPLAIVRPDLRVVLLEPLLRRATFLEEAVQELGLRRRVIVQRGRAEDLSAPADIFVARAVAPLARLVAWVAPVIGPVSELIALKGSSAAAEVAAAEPVLRRSRLRAEVLVVRAFPGSEPTHAVRVRRA
ncbi:MAG: 16S rRNA (guanine(527)-N(7))-methyltransferase RsmG [Propionibacterium sp.]|nr:16S rRNA (guanine(527)-N(7))-methyltransferase RsmG [Propionibacterium sp.]